MTTQVIVEWKNDEHLIIFSDGEAFFFVSELDVSSPGFRLSLLVVVRLMVLLPQGSPLTPPGGSKNISSGAPVDFFGGAVLQRLMGPAVVVQPHGFGHGGFGLRLRPEAPSQPVFLLQDAVHPLGLGVFIAWFSSVILMDKPHACALPTNRCELYWQPRSE